MYVIAVPSLIKSKDIAWFETRLFSVFAQALLELMRCCMLEALQCTLLLKIKLYSVWFYFGTELITLGRKLHSGTSKTKESRAGLVRVPLFRKSHCVTRVPA